MRTAFENQGTAGVAKKTKRLAASISSIRQALNCQLGLKISQATRAGT
jgi:hypothetical protein